MAETATDNRVSVCYVVAYRDPDYVRTHNVRAGLSSLGGYRLIDATNRNAGWLRYFETLGKLIRARIRHNPDVYLLGFRGHEIFWIVRLVTLGKRLVFDEFMSPSDALIADGKGGLPGRALGYLLYPLERMCLRFSDHCITDTILHKNFVAQRFSVPKEKIDVVYVGAKPSDAEPAPTKPPVSSSDSKLTVLFYGTFLPLHGMDVILRACALLRGLPIEFRIIGGSGAALRRFRQLHDDLGLDNVRHDTWVDFEQLKTEVIPDADLCLGGPFGGTPQARRVITGKTFQFLAQAKTVVIGRVDEPVGLLDRENCLLVEQNDAESLAGACRWALEHRDQLAEIGKKGQQLYTEKFSIGELARQLEPALRRSP